MIEFLSAVADGVHWDRARYSSIHQPDNWLATEAALVKRGLVRSIRQDPSKKRKSKTGDFWADAGCNCELTPAGKHVVELFKTVGLFIEAEGATIRRFA